MYGISIIVMIYNQPYTSVFSTLNSVIHQDFDDFEIIVADDCSKENPQEAVEEYFSKAGFTNYKIIVNSSNVGTVRNILGALEIADGTYIKTIGSGDLLYSSDTLRKLYEFSQLRDIDLAFGKVKTFSLEEGHVTTRPFNAPTKPEMYVNSQDHEVLFKQQVIWGDWIPGGSLFFRRDYLKDYLSMLATDYQVRYCEDFASTLVLLAEPIDYFDEYIIWYEWGVGISNDGSAATRRKMYKDHSNFYAELKRRYRNNSTVTKAYWLFKIKRFVMLHTPLHKPLNKFRSAQYLKAPREQNEDLTPGKDFLLMNLDLPHVTEGE